MPLKFQHHSKEMLNVIYHIAPCSHTLSRSCIINHVIGTQLCISEKERKKTEISTSRQHLVKNHHTLFSLADFFRCCWVLVTVSSCSKGFEEKAREIGRKTGRLLEKMNEAGILDWARRKAGKRWTPVSLNTMSTLSRSKLWHSLHFVPLVTYAYQQLRLNIYIYIYVSGEGKGV